MSLTVIDNENLLNDSIKYENYDKNNVNVKENVCVEIGFRRKFDEQNHDDYSVKKIPRYNEEASICPVILSGAQCGDSYLFDCENHRENVVEFIPLDERTYIASSKDTCTLSDSQKSCNVVPNRSSDDDICMDSCICITDHRTATPAEIASQRLHSKSKSTKEVNVNSTMSHTIVPCASIVSLDNSTVSTTPRSRDSPIKPTIPTKVSDNSLVVSNKTQNGEYENNDNTTIGVKGEYIKQIATNTTYRSSSVKEDASTTTEAVVVLPVRGTGTEESVCSYPVSELTRSSSLATSFSSVRYSRHRHHHYGHSRNYKEDSSHSSTYRHRHHYTEDHWRANNRGYSSRSRSRSRSRSSSSYNRSSQRNSKPHYSRSSYSYYKSSSSSGIAAVAVDDVKYRDKYHHHSRHYSAAGNSSDRRGGERVSFPHSTYSRCRSPSRSPLRSSYPPPTTTTTGSTTDMYYTNTLIDRKYGHKDLPLEWWERTEDCKDAKALHTERVDSVCDSREALVLKTTLWREDTVLEPNMFPYWTPKGVEHYTLWSIHELQHQQIVKVVDKWLHKHMPHVQRWQYDDNAGERSINLFHVHVFLETIPYSFTPRPELEYFPPHVQLIQA